MLGGNDVATLTLPDAVEIPLKDQLAWEKDLLGVYISEHPLQRVADELRDLVSITCDEIGEDVVGEKVVIAGMVTGVRRLITKKRDAMVAASIEDLHGSVEIVAFPKVYERTRELWEEDQILLIEGKVDARGDRVQIICEKATRCAIDASAGSAGESGINGRHPSGANGNGSGKQAREGGEDYRAAVRDNGSSNGSAAESRANGSRKEDAKRGPRHRISITIRRSDQDERDVDLLQQLYNLLNQHPKGEDSVDLCVASNGHERVELEFPGGAVRYNRKLKEELAELVGQEAVQIDVLE